MALMLLMQRLYRVRVTSQVHTGLALAARKTGLRQRAEFLFCKSWTIYSFSFVSRSHPSENIGRGASLSRSERSRGTGKLAARVAPPPTPHCALRATVVRNCLSKGNGPSQGHKVSFLGGPVFADSSSFLVICAGVGSRQRRLQVCAAPLR
ncbi:LOW QUALITY PROTEIN: hypothetical protein ENH_00066590 [Eimeria necatrix]|uniref:Uncharacterized protein n=1 Tax=Eimeria necatrix TaxID=51315 RepID=U6MZA4_9EIME|nr:LOW QUALITY PROTEIN: hypothetical protein ENH_00066590 [Eimeria necatrix]CDJ69306.1 hypothetical protein ENH_00066590 [Eimeria necatrix]